ncbi:hypothetical protein AYO38_05585 [bacterium SCGC AG-212-C10]|nr:hypothetical protein AYO38_05585 [bacterium SCGC AG-212-C10]
MSKVAPEFHIHDAPVSQLVSEFLFHTECVVHDPIAKRLPMRRGLALVLDNCTGTSADQNYFEAVRELVYP